jgi:undecaprenol kinase
MKNKPFYQRLKFAFDGLRETWLRERSFRTQILTAIAVFIAMLIVRPGWLWTGLIVVIVVVVLALELMNSAIEYLIDHMHPETAPEIKLAKDVGAAAVLLASFGALTVAGLLACNLIWP